MRSYATYNYLFLFAVAITTTVIAQQNETQQPTNPQQSQQQKECNICTISGSTLKSTDFPSHLSKSDIPPFLSIDELSVITNSSTNEMTCQEWQDYVSNHIITSIENNYDIATTSMCLSYQNWLQYSCCDGITTPLYKCQKAVKEKLLFSSNLPYDKEVAPIGGGSVIDTYTTIHVTDYSISNFGVQGGSIEVSGIILSKWNDNQLQWNPSDVGGCTELELKASHDPAKSDIWVPFRRSVTKPGVDAPTSKAIILSDGSVLWERTFITDFTCIENYPNMSKTCSHSISAKEGTLWNGDNINYIVGSSFSINDTGMSVDDQLLLPGYVINENLTFLEIVSDDATGDTEITGQIAFDPKEDTKCSLCGGVDGTTVRNDTIPLSFNDGVLFPPVNNLTCRQIEDLLLSNSYVGDFACYKRVVYAHECCDGLPSQNVCENNIRSFLLEKYEDGAVVPPDPAEGQSMIEVQVNLDIIHILDIDIRSNSLEVLVSLELLWYDKSKAWDPFIGECTSASFRASLDPEATEIWVPEIDLMNQIEGTSGFPNSFATVFNTGAVWWRRTGVLKVACDLRGVKYFPFDHPACSLDFGAPRSPVAHRVNYTVGSVEFSERLRDQTGAYQEYHVDVNETVITSESESMSMYTNIFIRFSFVFDRAVPYYMWGFVLLYILFTYLSFGMFYLDTQVGERLGFGTGILFVIVAQDITVAEYTPITQEQLWINQLSLGCKLFVVFATVQSIVVLHYYFVNDLNGDGVDNEFDLAFDDEERGGVEKQEESNHLIRHSTSTDILDHDDNDEEESTVYHSDVGQIDKNNDNSNNDIGNINTSNKETEGEENNNENSALFSPSSRAPMKAQMTEIGPTSRNMIRCLLGVDVGPDASIQKQKVMKLRLLDRLAAYVFLFAYTVFVVVMFAIGSAKSGED